MKSPSKKTRAAAFVGGPIDGYETSGHDGKFPKVLPIPFASRLHRYALRYYRNKKTGEIRFRYAYRGVMDCI